MTTRRDKAINFMLRNEDRRYDTAAHLENLNDGAGVTFIGLTARDDTRYLPPGMTIVDLADLYERDKEAALKIIRGVYDEKYYHPLYDHIVSERIAIRLFDLGVNCGPATAVKMIQRAVNCLGVPCNPDGFFGPATLEAVNACDADKLHGEFIRIADARYHKLAEDPKYEGKYTDFLDGWLNRLNRDEYEV